MKAYFRSYNLEYETKNDKKTEKYLDYYNVYVKYGYEYLYKEYGCEVEFRYLCSFWDRRELKYTKLCEIRETILSKRREMIFQNWKNGGMAAALKYLNRPDTKGNRAVIFDILRRYYLKEYTEILNQRK